MREDNGGHLTPAERAKVDRQQDRISRGIYQQKHDAQTQGTQPKTEIGERKENQQDRIGQGIQSGELTAGEIAERFDFSKPALSSHLRVLEEAGLIAREKRGQFVYFKLVPERVANTVFAWAAELCPVAGPLKRESRANAKRKTRTTPA
jgi:DNA-binding transcriptional ArsR family regulator